jgi:hypothetical protein
MTEREFVHQQSSHLLTGISVGISHARAQMRPRDFAVNLPRCAPQQMNDGARIDPLQLW